MPKQSKKMSEQEIEQWNNLYEYVRQNIMKYDKNQSLSHTTVLRLKGLATNKFIETRNVDDTANYSYEVILNTFKFCCLKIKKVLENKSFEDESHKINYILKIVEPNINTVYQRMKDSEIAKQEQERLAIAQIVAQQPYTNHFQAPPEEKLPPKLAKEFEDMW